MVLGVGRSGAAIASAFIGDAYLHSILGDVHARIDQKYQHQDDEADAYHHGFIHAPVLSSKKFPIWRNFWYRSSISCLSDRDDSSSSAVRIACLTNSAAFSGSVWAPSGGSGMMPSIKPSD